MPIKILYVMRNMAAGGAETFLLSMLRVMNREKFQASIASIYGGGALQKEFENIGVRTYPYHFKGLYDLKSYHQLYLMIVFF